MFAGDSSHSEYLFKDCYFIGGEANYSKYLQSNPKIKKLSKKYKIDDFVMIAVRIDSIGTPLKYNFIYSIEDCPKCNKEAMKMIKRIKKWDATDVIDENGKLKKASIVFSVKVPFNSTE